MRIYFFFRTLFFVLLFAVNMSHASEKSCATVLADRRFGQLTQSALSIALEGSGSGKTLLRHLKVLTQQTTSAATERIRDNALLVAPGTALSPVKLPEFSEPSPLRTKWLPQILSRATFGWIKQDSPRFQSISNSVAQSAQQLRSQLATLKKEIDQLETAVQATANMQAELQRDIDLIQDLISWLTEISSSSPEMTRIFAIKLNLADLYIDLNAEIAALKSQINFLKPQVDPMSNRRKNLVEMRSKINQFFLTQWPAMQARLQDRQALAVGFQRFPDDVPEVSDQILDSGFDRRFYFGDRLLQAISFKGVWHLHYTFYQRFQQKDGRKLAGFVRLHEVVHHRQPSRLGQDILLKNLNEEKFEPNYELALARPGMKIDQFQLHQDLEIDLARALDDVLQTELNSEHPFQSFFAHLNYISTMELFSNDKYLIRDLDSPAKVEKALAKRKRKIEAWYQEYSLRESGNRYFVKILGTNPRINSVLVAIWRFDTKTSETGSLKMLEITRSDLRYLKPYSDLSFHWPQLDHLDLLPLMEPEQ